jgi:hypothetical protein
MVYYQEPLEKLLPYLHNCNIKIIEIKPKIGHFQPQQLEEVIELKRNYSRVGFWLVHIYP